MLGAVTLLTAQTAYGQNYARYCARDTDQLASDLTFAMTSQDENYLATMYNWQGFSSTSAYAKMGNYGKLVQRSLYSVDPITPGIPLSLSHGTSRGPLLAMSLAILAWFQVVPPPVEDTPEIGPYPEPEDDRGLGKLPPLPRHEPEIRPEAATTTPSTEVPSKPASTNGPNYNSRPEDNPGWDPRAFGGHDDTMETIRRNADRFEQQLQKDIGKLASEQGWDQPLPVFDARPPVASGIRVITHSGFMGRNKQTLTFGVMQHEGCYWLTGG